MGKNLVVCCDGTGGQYGELNSNVVNLYKTLVQDEGQRCYYHPGVGTMGSPTSRNWVEATWSTLLGLGFGAGLLTNVGDAYRYLMNSYEDGDAIYLFGFSRGAYTARAISAMLQMYGLLCPGNEGMIPYILRMFAKRSRKAAGMQQHFAEAAGFKACFSRAVEVHCVGVWDTVSSVGMIWDPLKLAYTARNPCMKNGRHAISIDERRCFFRNNLWGEAYPGQNVKQVWFAGTHSDVGGSYKPTEAGLSQITLEWMLNETTALGLRVNATKVERVLGCSGSHPPVEPEPLQPKHESLTWRWWPLEFIPRRVYDFTTQKKSWVIPLGRRRQIPPGSMFHETVKLKVAGDKSYRPTNLPQGWDQNLDAWVRWPGANPATAPGQTA